MPRYLIKYSTMENYEIQVNAKTEDEALSKFDNELAENGFDNFTYMGGETVNLNANLIKNSESVEL